MKPMQAMAEHAATGKLALQHCLACGAVQYPPRELCASCLSDSLAWRITDAEGGELLAATALHHSHEPTFRDALPLRVGLARFTAGPTVVCFLADGCDVGSRVRIAASIDTAGCTVLTATPAR